MKQMRDSYVILDLDHTLVNSVVSPVNDPRLTRACDFYFRIAGIYYYVYKRPGVDEYINTLFTVFKGVAVWTAAVATYAKQVVKGLFGARAGQLAFIWTRRHCAVDMYGRYKPLRKVWQDPVSGKFMKPNNTVHVDNTADVMRYNRLQALLVPHYFSHRTEDTYLFYLTNLTRSRGINLPNYIRRANLLTQWWNKNNPLN